MKRYVFGVHAVNESLSSDDRKVVLVLTSSQSDRVATQKITEKAQKLGIPCERCHNEQLDRLAKGVKHQGIAAVIGGDYPYIDLAKLLEKTSNSSLIVALDEITDVHNFGAIIRSCVALGADGIVTLRDRAAPVTPAVVRTSAGATEHALIARVTNLSNTLLQLREQGYWIVGLDAEATTTLPELDVSGPLVLVTGSEGKGLRRLVRERCDVLAKIPMAGPLGSLNASVATAIALYEIWRKRNVNDDTTDGFDEEQ